MTDQPGTNVGTQGDAPERQGDQIGVRNQLRARWRALAFEARAGIAIALTLLLALGAYRLDHSLAWAVLTVAALYWIHRLPRLPWRLAAQIAVAALFIWRERSFGIALAIVFAVFWIPQRVRVWVLPAVAIVLTVLYPFYQGKMFVIPVFGVWPDVATAVYMLVFVMMAVGLNIVVGYAGLLDLGYVAFYATGAYTAAWFSSLQFAHHKWHFGAVGITPDLPGLHVSIFLLLILAGVITALFGIIIGLPTLRLRGDYLAIVTLGFGEILPQIARNGDNFFGTGFNLTNGPNGITPLDSPGFGNGISDLTHGVLPANYLTCCSRTMLGHQIVSTDVFFWTAIVLLLITVFCSFRLQFSRLGRAWIAIREDETAAAAMGVPLMRTKTWAYASGAFFGGIAGAYYAAFKSATFPGDFFFNISVFILCMVILGGMGNIWGVIVGAAFLAYLDREGLANTGSWLNTNLSATSFNLLVAGIFLALLLYNLARAREQVRRFVLLGLIVVDLVLFVGLRIIHLPIEVPLYASGIYGLIILIVMLLRPEGLIPSRRRAAELHEGVHDEPLYDIAHAGAEG
jgi:branched-chain amino acid transport system permease protein